MNTIRWWACRTRGLSAVSKRSPVDTREVTAFVSFCHAARTALAQDTPQTPFGEGVQGVQYLFFERRELLIYLAA